MRKFLFAVLTAVVALSNLGYAAAQTGPSGPQTPTAPTAPAAPAVNGISENEMLNYLRTLDPNVKMQKSQDGKKTIFEANLNRDGWRYQLTLILDEYTLQIHTNLGSPIANIQSIPAQTLAQLWAQNWTMNSQFYLIQQKDGRLTLCLHRDLSRTGLTTASLGNLMERFCNDVRQTYPAWNAVLSASK